MITTIPFEYKHGAPATSSCPPEGTRTIYLVQVTGGWLAQPPRPVCIYCRCEAEPVEQ